MENSSEWNHVISSYKEYSVDFDGRTEMIWLTEKLAASDYARHISPKTSVWSLLLSPVSEYKEMVDHPLISVRYVRDSIFKLEYYGPGRTRTRPEESFDVHMERVWSMLETLFLRIEIIRR